MPLPRKSMNFSSQSGVIWCILSHMRYSEVPLEGKNKTLVKILVGRLHRTTPAGQILGVATPATPAALTLMNVTLLAFAAAAPLLLSAGRAAIDRYLLPARRTAANPQR